MPVWGRGAPLSRRWDLALLGVISSRIDKRLRSLDPGEVWIIPGGMSIHDLITPSYPSDNEIPDGIPEHLCA